VEGAGLGLSREWAERLSSCQPERRQVLSVQRLLPSSPTRASLQEGDLILAIDGTPVNSFMAVEACVLERPSVRLTLLRDAMESEIQVTTSEIASDGTTQLIMWCGLILQHTYRAVSERGFQPDGGGVYISYYLFGSPAHKYKLVPKHWVIELNGEPVSDLPSFLALVEQLPHAANVRVKTCDLNGKVAAYTVKTDHNYWRGYEVFRRDGQWVWRSLNQSA